MTTLLSQLSEYVAAAAVGSLMAAAVMAALQLLYRLLVGRERPYMRDVLGTSVAAAAAGVGIFMGPLTANLLPPAMAPTVAIALLVIIILVGLVLARRMAGYQDVRSIASDIVPLVLASLLSLLLIGMFGLLSQL